MALDCCGKFLKYVMFIFNFLFTCGGIAILAIGIWTTVDKPALEGVLGTNLYIAASYIEIAAGCAIILISFFGCFGAVKEIKCLLMTFVIILLLIFIVLLVGGILIYVFRGEVQRKVKDVMTSAMLHSYDSDPLVKDAFNFAQNYFNCCAVDNIANYKLWERSNWHKELPEPKLNVPASCCENDTVDQLRSCQTEGYETPSPYLHKMGCMDKIIEFFQLHVLPIAAIAIPTGCCMILGIIFAMGLYRKIGCEED